MYIERQDIDNVVEIKTLIQLTNDDSKASEPDENKVTNIINFVNDLIEDNLRGRYNLPLTSIPNTLKDSAKQIAKYKLYELRDKNTERTEKSYSNALSILKNYRDGVILLEEYSPTQPSISSIIKINHREKVFNNL